MSIFSRIRGAKKAADKHKQSKAAEAGDQPKPARYKHIPTHAAQDAMLGAPTAWTREDNRAKIQAQNKVKRETMTPAASDYASSSKTQLPRSHSDLSIASVMKRRSAPASQFLGPNQSSGKVNRPYFSHSNPTGSTTPMRSSPLASAPASTVPSSGDSTRTGRSSPPPHGIEQMPIPAHTTPSVSHETSTDSPRQTRHSLPTFAGSSSKLPKLSVTSIQPLPGGIEDASEKQNNFLHSIRNSISSH